MPCEDVPEIVYKLEEKLSCTLNINDNQSFVLPSVPNPLNVQQGDALMKTVEGESQYGIRDFNKFE